MDVCRSLSRPVYGFEEQVPANRFLTIDVATVIYLKYVHEYRICVDNQGNITTEK